MFGLYKKLKEVNGGGQARLGVASEKYTDLYRDKTESLSTTTKQMHTFLLTSSPRKELWIFRPLTLHVRAVIDNSHEMNSV